MSPAARRRLSGAPLAAAPPRAARAELLFEPRASLMDLVDNILNKGLIITGDVVLSLAGVDLVYLRLSALLCAADRAPGLRGYHRPRRARRR